MSAVTESLDFAVEMIAVKYKGKSAKELYKKCELWLEKYNDSYIRDEYRGSRMIESQLDLFSKALDRVVNIQINCKNIIVNN